TQTLQPSKVDGSTSISAWKRWSSRWCDGERLDSRRGRRPRNKTHHGDTEARRRPGDVDVIGSVLPTPFAFGGQVRVAASLASVVCLWAFISSPAEAQQTSSATIPRVVRLSGTFLPADGQPAA